MRAYAGKGLTAVAVMAVGWMLAPAGFTDSQESHRGQDVIKACVEKRGGESAHACEVFERSRDVAHP